MRRRHPPAPDAPRHQKPRTRPPASVEDVMSRLDGLPVVRGDGGVRVRTYLEGKCTNHPDWWEAQSVEQLARLGQVFGSTHAV